MGDANVPRGTVFQFSSPASRRCAKLVPLLLPEGRPESGRANLDERVSHA